MESVIEALQSLGWLHFVSLFALVFLLLMPGQQSER